MAPWIPSPAIDLDLNQPIGSRYSHLSDTAIESGRTLLSTVIDPIPDIARLAVPLVQERTGNRFQPEVESLGKRFDVDWRDILLANISYDLTVGAFGCSTIALATPDGPVVARNMDWHPPDDLARSSYLMNANDGDKFQYAAAGWPGSIGVVTGLSGNGFGIVLNAVLCDEGARTDGYPVMLHIRRVLEDAANYEQAVELLKVETLASSALFTVVGRENHQRAVIERTPTRQHVRTAEIDEPLVATNHYRKLYEPAASDDGEIFQTTCDRYAAIARFFQDHSRSKPVSDEHLLYLLTDPQVIQTITAQHIIMRPADNQIRLFTPRRFSLQN